MPTGALHTEPQYRNALVHVDGLGSEMETGTAVASAVTINGYVGKITTESLTTAQNAIETLTLTNDKIAAGDLVFVTIANGTNTQGTAMLGEVTPAAGSCTIEVINKHASSESFNGTLTVGFFVVKSVSGL